MSQTERRRCRRLPIHWFVTGHVLSSSEQILFWGSTIDISSSGLLFTTSLQTFCIGMEFQVNLCVPPHKSFLMSGGRIRAQAQVRRKEARLIASLSEVEIVDSCVVAAQFTMRPYLMLNGNEMS